MLYLCRYHWERSKALTGQLQNHLQTKEEEITWSVSETIYFLVCFLQLCFSPLTLFIHEIDEVFQLKGDEDLARALQESLKLGEPSPWNRNVSGSCYNESNHPRCDVCKNFVSICFNFRKTLHTLNYHSHEIHQSFLQIRKNTAGVVVYKAHPFWGQKYCVFHEHDGTTRCCSCERMEVSFH